MSRLPMDVFSDRSPAGRSGPSDGPGGLITTPAGSTIEPVEEGGYQVCDAGHHCLRAPTLWQAQQLVQWAEVHHQHLESDRMVLPSS